MEKTKLANTASPWLNHLYNIFIADDERKG